jgi:hypothetical protein
MQARCSSQATAGAQLKGRAQGLAVFASTLQALAFGTKLEVWSVTRNGDVAHSAYVGEGENLQIPRYLEDSVA